jgi:DNA-binding transcriptional ArsR family regulator
MCPRGVSLGGSASGTALSVLPLVDLKLPAPVPDRAASHDRLAPATRGAPEAGEAPAGLDAARERGGTRGPRCRAHLPVLTYNRMVVGTAETERADALFHALADPTRRDILAVVLQDAHSVSDLARRYPISFAAVHKHVGALERAGLVTKTRHGREQRVRGNVATLRTAHRLLDDLEALWRGRIDRIEQVLAHPTERAPQ